MARHARSLAAKRRAGSPCCSTPSSHMLKKMAIRAAATMPAVKSHWKMPVPLPRLSALRHSARYSGTTTPIRPALMPWSSRPVSSGTKPAARAMIGMLTTNNSPLRNMSPLRPRRSESRPAKSVEITLPASTAATIQERSLAVSREVACK